VDRRSGEREETLDTPRVVARAPAAAAATPTAAAIESDASESVPCVRRCGICGRIGCDSRRDIRLVGVEMSYGLCPRCGCPDIVESGRCWYCTKCEATFPAPSVGPRLEPLGKAVCPKCGSGNIKRPLDTPTIECDDCGALFTAKTRNPFSPYCDSTAISGPPPHKREVTVSWADVAGWMGVLSVVGVLAFLLWWLLP